jgi:hypothetical protein
MAYKVWNCETISLYYKYSNTTFISIWVYLHYSALLNFLLSTLSFFNFTLFPYICDYSASAAILDCHALMLSFILHYVTSYTTQTQNCNNPVFFVKPQKFNIKNTQVFSYSSNLQQLSLSHPTTHCIFYDPPTTPKICAYATNIKTRRCKVNGQNTHLQNLSLWRHRTNNLRRTQ